MFKFYLSSLNFMLILFSFSLMANLDYEPYAQYKQDKYLIPLKIDKEINFDGILNDKQWITAELIDDFIQAYPNHLSNPAEITQVKVLYDDHNLYIGVNLSNNYHDITKKTGEYDQFYDVFENNSDYFIVEIDSKHNHKESYAFAINVSGVKADYMIYNDSEIDDYWNVNWDATVKIDSNKWSIEYKIPFSSLRYPVKKNNVFGINFIRYIKNNNEISSWIVLPEITNKIVSEYGHLIDLELDNQNSLIFKPYYLIGEIEYDDYFYDIYYPDPEEEDDIINPEIASGPQENSYHLDNKNKIGLDLKYIIKSNTVLDFTYNPDFGQIEQDPSIINNTAYEIRFDEKRPFFLENKTFFDSPINIFYSRRIGDKINYFDNNNNYKNEQSNFNSAIRFIGNDNNWDYGFLISQSEIESNDDLDIYHGVFRMQTNVLNNNSRIGFMNTYYEFNGFKNYVYSLDFSLDLFDNKSYLDGQIVTSDSYQEEGRGINIEYGYLYPLSTNGKMEFWIKNEHYNKTLDINKTGYLFRNNLNLYNSGLSISKYLSNKSIKEYIFSIQYNNSKNDNGELLSSNFLTNYKIVFNNYSNLVFGVFKDLDRFNDKFYDDYFDDLVDIDLMALKEKIVKLPKISSFYINFSNDPRNKINFIIENNFFQNNVGDKGFRYYVNTIYKINQNIDLDFGYEESKESNKYHFLKIKRFGNNSSIGRDDDYNYEYLFVNSDNYEKIFTFRLSAYLKRKLSLQIYYEFYRYSNGWDEYSTIYNIVEDDPNNIYPHEKYPNNSPPYPPLIALSNNDEIIYISKYTSSALNFVIKSEAIKNSNLYFVYSINKGINGRIFNNFFDLLDFGDQDIGLNKAEIFYDHSFFIKYDIWFDFNN